MLLRLFPILDVPGRSAEQAVREDEGDGRGAGKCRAPRGFREKPPEGDRGGKLWCLTAERGSSDDRASMLVGYRRDRSTFPERFDVSPTTLLGE